MYILVPGAWPEPAIAKEMAQHLEQNAPGIAKYLGSHKARITPCPIEQNRCCPHEAWSLRASGFNPRPNEHISAGLAALRLASTSQRQIWAAELVHMAPARDSAGLLPARSLDISAQHSQDLFASAAEVFAESGLQVEYATSTTWQISWPEEDLELACASPELVAASTVSDWWPQQPEARAWRRLVNSLQMLWYEHPVNQERAHQGLAPVNSLWLYGGARRAQFSRALPGDLEVDFGLLDYFQQQNWGGWLQALANLERRVATANKPVNLVLCARERYVEFTPSNRLATWLRQSDWKKWWSTP